MFTIYSFLIKLYKPSTWVFNNKHQLYPRADFNVTFSF